MKNLMLFRFVIFLCASAQLSDALVGGYYLNRWRSGYPFDGWCNTLNLGDVKTVTSEEGEQWNCVCAKDYGFLKSTMRIGVWERADGQVWNCEMAKKALRESRNVTMEGVQVLNVASSTAKTMESLVRYDSNIWIPNHFSNLGKCTSVTENVTKFGLSKDAEELNCVCTKSDGWVYYKGSTGRRYWGSVWKWNCWIKEE